MMNKYFIIIIIGVLVIGGGVAYKILLAPDSSGKSSSGVTREVTIIARKDKWLFEPEIIEVNRGDKIVATVVNEDDYDHGIAIDAFGVSQRMPANATIKVEFVATQEGEFPFYCSVPCGEGVVDGKKRTQFDMVGKMHVRSIVSGAQ